MSRKRMLDPAFFTSAAVNSVPIPAMVTFAGLWVYFDDYGRGEHDEALIKATVWPRRRSHTEAKVAADIQALIGAGLVHPYEVGGARLLHSPSWHEHQRISHRTDSKFPPCPVHEDLLYREFLRDSGGPLERFRSGPGIMPEPFHDSVVKVSLEKNSLGAPPGTADPSGQPADAHTWASKARAGIQAAAK